MSDPKRANDEPGTPEPSPLAGYAPYRRAGDLVFVSGMVPYDAINDRVVAGYGDLPAEQRRAAGQTGMVSIDRKDGPVAAQSWWLFTELQRIANELGGTMEDVVHLAQYLTDLSTFPVYSRVRERFFEQLPASTLVGVCELMPEPSVAVEVQATLHLPAR